MGECPRPCAPPCMHLCTCPVAEPRLPCTQYRQAGRCDGHNRRRGLSFLSLAIGIGMASWAVHVGCRCSRLSIPLVAGGASVGCSHPPMPIGCVPVMSLPIAGIVCHFRFTTQWRGTCRYELNMSSGTVEIYAVGNATLDIMGLSYVVEEM